MMSPLKHPAPLTAAALSLLVLLLASCSENPVEGDPGCITCLPPPLVHDNPRWSPDGRRILYYDHGLINYDPQTNRREHDPARAGIWVMDLETGEQHKLLDAYEADWSPDGQSLLVDGGQIYTIRLSGDTVDASTIVQLTPGGSNFHAEWSPDGEWIAHDRSLADEHGPSGVWIVRPDGSDWHFIFGGNMPTWHPDGRSVTAIIGVSATSIETRFVKYYPFDETPPVTLIPAPDRDNLYPRYSPDGSQILFQSKSQVCIVDADGTNFRQLTATGGGHPDWSPDGERIVYLGPQHTLWTMNADGTDKKQLTFRPELGPIRYTEIPEHGGDAMPYP